MAMNKIAKVALTITALAIGGGVGFVLATKPEVREQIAHRTRGAYQATRKRVDTMSEDVALRTAKMTKNPKVNQEYVEHQWGTII